ncbi:hypothetical protein ACFVT5_35505 [Streptomyces sp. NPDC058001]|uniref:hypothetical protein n=1 Tax=Streptomyces sp. NPDC058001 TaxID=3346300 RepID=UPI0036E56BA0
MSTPHSLPDAGDKKAMRAWLAARRSESTDKPLPRTLTELRSVQLKRLARSMESDTDPESAERPDRPILRFALDGETVRTQRVESAVLGDWLRALQTTVQSVAYALDELRPTRDSGPVPKEIQRMTRLFSGPVFASSYGMVLEGAPEAGQAELPGTGGDVLLDRAMNRIFDVADRASSGAGAEDAVLDAALPLGRRVISHLSELSDVLASTGTSVTLTWESKATARRTSTLTSESAERCRTTLRAAQVEDSSDRLVGTVVGGSKLRGVIEIEVDGNGIVVVRTSKEDVPALLAGYAERHVEADVHVLTARSAGGREHRSYVLLDLSLGEPAAQD